MSNQKNKKLPLINEKKMLLSNKKFIDEKKNLTDILSTNANKILFPKEFIQDIKCVKNKLYILLYYIEEYNKTITKSRQLLKKIEKLSSWGYVFNSYDSWNISTYNIMVQIKKYAMLIVYFFQNNEKLLKKIFGLDLTYNEWIEKINIFVYLRKTISDGETNYIYVKDFGKINLIEKYPLEQVEELLPILTNQMESKDKIKYYHITDMY